MRKFENEKNYFLSYLREGFIPIPLNSELKPAVRWSDFLEKRPSEKEVLEWGKNFHNMALICGKVSSLTVIDIDDMVLFETTFGKSLVEHLFQSAGAIVQTKSGGFHLWFNYHPELQSKQYQSLGFDIKNDKSLVNVPPTNGYSFQELRDGKTEIPSEFFRKLKQLETFKELPAIIELLREIYIEGYRQEICLCLAGLLRKTGFTQEKTEEILKEVLQELEPAIDRDTLKQRLSAITSTFKKERESIKGLSGLTRIAEELLGLEASIKWTEKLQTLLGIKSNEAITSEEFKEAQKLLRDPQLLDRIIDFFDKAYLGRQKEKKLLYLICLFTKINFSTLCVIAGDTSSGKSSLVKTVTSAFPDEQKLAFNATSEKFFLYLNQPLKSKILTIFEIGGAISLPFLKTFITEGVSSLGTVIKVKGELKPVEIRKSTEGLVLITTTTKQTFDEETINRGFLIPLETSQVFTREILNFNPQQPNYKILQALYKLLKPKNVAIPYQKILATSFPNDKPRRIRDFKKILSLIKAHALLYQYQREQKEDEIIADLSDYEAVFDLADLIIPAFSEMTQKMKKFLEWLKPKKTASEVNKYPHASLASVKRWKKSLMENGFIEKIGDEFFVVDDPSVFSGLPKPEDIKNLMSQLADMPKTLVNTNFEMAQGLMSHNEPMSQPESSNGSWLKSAQEGLSQPEALKNKDLTSDGSLAQEDYEEEEFTW